LMRARRRPRRPRRAPCRRQRARVCAYSQNAPRGVRVRPHHRAHWPGNDRHASAACAKLHTRALRRPARAAATAARSTVWDWFPRKVPGTHVHRDPAAGTCTCEKEQGGDQHAAGSSRGRIVFLCRQAHATTCLSAESQRPCQNDAHVFRFSRTRLGAQRASANGRSCYSSISMNSIDSEQPHNMAVALLAS
jgi:hypothetical protein